MLTIWSCLEITWNCVPQNTELMSLVFSFCLHAPAPVSVGRNFGMKHGGFALIVWVWFPGVWSGFIQNCLFRGGKTGLLVIDHFLSLSRVEVWFFRMFSSASFSLLPCLHPCSAISRLLSEGLDLSVKFHGRIDLSPRRPLEKRQLHDTLGPSSVKWRC